MKRNSKNKWIAVSLNLIGWAAIIYWLETTAPPWAGKILYGLTLAMAGPFWYYWIYRRPKGRIDQPSDPKHQSVGVSVTSPYYIVKVTLGASLIAGFLGVPCLLWLPYPISAYSAIGIAVVAGIIAAIKLFPMLRRNI